MVTAFYNQIKLSIIGNRNGTLQTSVYEKQATEPYTVPFRSDHRKNVFRHAIQTLLLRALQYSTILSQFEEERHQIKLMFLYTGFVFVFHSLKVPTQIYPSPNQNISDETLFKHKYFATA